MDAEWEELLRTFIAETDEHLGEMEAGLLALEADPSADDRLGAVFRAAHTLKGNASTLGLEAITNFAHQLEDLLERLRSRRLPVSQGLITVLLESVDALRVLVPEAVAGGGGLSEIGRTMLAALAARLPAVGAEDGVEAGRGERDTEAGEAEDDEGPEAWSGGSDPAVVGGDIPESLGARTLRVDRRKLDLLLDLTGEIAVSRARLGQVLALVREERGEEALEIHRDSEKLHMELQELVMKARMVPVGPVFRRYARTVRDLATGLGKLARLRIEGGEVEVDTAVIEHLRDPLTHMIRNAVDHGIEAIPARKAAGKDPCGTILLRVYHDAGNVVVQVKDDGAGLNRERIAERARALGFASEPERLPDPELFALVLEPGFSTAATVTDLSGRGIGMDVVRRRVEALRGTLRIESRPGEGTTITIRLPLTLAIIPGFLVGVAAETYVIPMDAVLECLELPLSERERARGRGVINIRGKALPYVRLRELFSLGGEPPERESVIVVRCGEEVAGLAVDLLYGERQTVIKPLGKLFQHLSGVAGSTVLGSGRVALILDVAALLERLRRPAPGEGQAVAAG